MSEFPSHYRQIINKALDQDALYPDGIAVAFIPSLMERKDGGSIFDEGEAFSGAERSGSAEAYITATASPHIRPSLPKGKLIEAAENVLGRPVRLPEGMNDVEMVSSQLLVWWRDIEAEDGVADLLHVAELPPEKQEQFCSVVAIQTARATEIIGKATHKPTIWGSWGFGTPQERAHTGKGRGVPTNKHGHLHIIDFASETPQDTTINSLSASEKLNHYKPWGSLLHELFSGSFARTISLSFNGCVPSADVRPFAQTLEDSHGAVRVVNEGYSVDFAEPVPFAQVLKALVNTAGILETFYGNVARQHARYYKHQSNPEIIESALLGIADDARGMGFSDAEAERLAEFALRIRPTYSQICTWLAELEIDSGIESPEDAATLHRKKEQYERVNDYLGKTATEDSLAAALIKDTVSALEDYRTSRSVWPEHATSTYIIEDYDVRDGVVMVKNLRLIPGIDSTESAPEQITGRALRRSIGVR